MRDTYPGSDLEIIEKALYCNEHGDTESCENWLNHLRDRLASAAPAEGRELNAVERVGLIRQALSVVKQDYSGECSQMATRREYVEDAVSQLIDAGYRTATAPTMSEAARDVLAERRRQIEQEGWTLKHDDEHDGGQLPMAAASYAVAASYASAGLFPMPKGAPPTSWPWRKSWWKPTTPRRDLVKAGALILAEIERIDRAAAKGGSK